MKKSLRILDIYGKKSIEHLESFLEQGGDINEKDGSEAGLLYYATNYRYTNVVEFLLKHEKLDVNSQDYFGTTALHVAARNGYMEIAKLLLARGADVNLTDKEGETPLHNSILTMHCLELIPLLMGRGANIHARRAEEGSTVLHLAARTGEVKIYKCLLEFGADPDMRTFELRDIVDGEEVVTRSYSAKELYRKLYPEKIKEFEAAEREVEAKRNGYSPGERVGAVGGSRKREHGFTGAIEDSRNTGLVKPADESSPEKPSENKEKKCWADPKVKRPRLGKDLRNSADNREEQKPVVRGF